MGVVVRQSTPNNMESYVTKIIAVAAHKGGVGKTSSTVMAAAELSKRKFKTLVIDNDPQGNASSALTLNADGTEVEIGDTITARLYSPNCSIADIVPLRCHSGIDLIPSPPNCDIFRQLIVSLEDRWIFSDNLKDLCEQYDIVLIDCPPNYSVTTTAALMMADYVLCPIKINGHGLGGLKGILKTIAEVRARDNPTLRFLGCFINLMERSDRLDMNAQEIRRELGNLVFTSMIYRRLPIDTVQDIGGTLGDLGYAHVADKEVKGFVTELVERLYEND